jgi:succinate-semialdehyde dehydrogenase/glutarate-semialdehyde dehydrogenase
MQFFTTINPFNGQKIADYPLDDATAVEQKLQQAVKAYSYWSALELDQRIILVDRLLMRLEARADYYAQMITEETGKVLSESKAEIAKCASLCRHYMEAAPRYLADEFPIPNDDTKCIVHQPVGAVLAIMPWNFPFWQVFRCAVPALLAGNVILLKHAPNVCACSVALEALFIQAGFPQNTFQSLLIDIPLVEKVIEHPIVQGVALTGSGRAGASVASISGKNIKKTVLELGGSDPFIVLDDADMETAATVAVQSRFINAGQSCIAAKRWIVTEQVYAAFELLVKAKIAELVQGDPVLAETTIGPMARLDLAQQFMQQYQTAIEEGATVVIPCEQSGCNISAGMLADVTPEMRVFREELFGPCAVLIKAANAQDAIRLANLSPFGLGATVFSNHAATAMETARKLRTGNVYINGLMRSDPALPFGGVGLSGYGKELGRDGILAFVNSKVIVNS